MSVQFKAILRGEPGVEGGGEKKYYALALSSGSHSLLKLSTYICKATTVNKTDVLAVLSSLVEFMAIELAVGPIMHIKDLLLRTDIFFLVELKFIENHGFDFLFA
jgi:hypothetical protein